MPKPPKWEPVKGSRPGAGPVRLPAEGRSGPPPPWPLDEGLSAGEQRAWQELWGTPHAVAWERLGCLRIVARYCRIMVAAEAHGAPASLLAQVCALEDRLGLSPKSMRLMLWVVADEVAERQAVSSSHPRVRLRPVDPLGGAS